MYVCTVKSEFYHLKIFSSKKYTQTQWWLLRNSDPVINQFSSKTNSTSVPDVFVSEERLQVVLE